MSGLVFVGRHGQAADSKSDGAATFVRDVCEFMVDSEFVGLLPLVDRKGSEVESGECSVYDCDCDKA